MATISSILNHALTKPVDLSKVSMPDAVAVLRQEFGDDPYHGSFVHPEGDALDFYLSNHVVGLILAKNNVSTTLGRTEQHLLERYVERQSRSTLRAFAYLLLICSREMRHCHNSSATKCKITKDEKKVYDYMTETLMHHHGTAIAQTIWSGEVGFDLGVWSSVLEKVFRFGGFPGGYGGPNWADVALPLREYVHGVYTAEMMIDVVWTLCHNHGPIFNKGMFYHCHTHELLRILDVQRAGQVPQFKWEWEGGGMIGLWYGEFLAAAIDVFPELCEEPDFTLIKSTALHPALWSDVKYKTPGLKTVKPPAHGTGGVTIAQIKVDRDGA